MYSISFDPRSGVLTAHTSSFWSFDETFEFEAALQERIGEHAQQRSIRLLIDSVQTPVQTNEVVQALADIGRKIRRSPDDRIAVVAGSALKRFQVRRIFADGDAQIFEQQDDALEWLTQ